MMKSFIVSLDISALEKYKSESEPYYLMVDTGKVKTVGEFISWFQNLFSISDPVALLNDNTKVNVKENVQVLYSKNIFVVEPSTPVNISSAKLPILEEECKEIVGVPPAAEKNGVECIPAVAPVKDEKTDEPLSRNVKTSDKKKKAESNPNKRTGRSLYLCHYTYENEKLTENIKEIEVESPWSFPSIVSDDMLLYRCYSKSLKSLCKHVAAQSVPQTLSCNVNNEKNRPVKRQPTVSKKQNKMGVEPQNGAPKAKDSIPKNKPKKQETTNIQLPINTVGVKKILNKKSCINALEKGDGEIKSLKPALSNISRDLAGKMLFV